MKGNRPFLKWAGNKYRCIEHILQSLPPANRLIEPFAGSASVFLNTNYQNYLICEMNHDLIALFNYVKNDGENFINQCEQLFSPEYNNAISYYKLREEFNLSANNKRKAAIFLYLNRHGYNGLCRYNQQGIFNVPFGSYRKPYFPRKEMVAFQAKSQSSTFIQSDFRDTFKKAIQGDVIYCDPPYVPLTQQSNFSSYTHKKFGYPEQIALAQLAQDAASKGITVVISNHDTEFTRDHYKKSTIYSFPVRRSISCKAGSRILINEILAVFS